MDICAITLDLREVTRRLIEEGSGEASILHQCEGLVMQIEATGAGAEFGELALRIGEMGRQLSRQGETHLGGLLARVEMRLAAGLFIAHMSIYGNNHYYSISEMRLAAAGEIQLQYKVMVDAVDLGHSIREKLGRFGLYSTASRIDSIREGALDLDADLGGIVQEAVQIASFLREHDADLEGEAMEVDRMATGLKAVMAAQLAARLRDSFLEAQVGCLDTAISYNRDRWLLTHPQGEILQAELAKFSGKPGSEGKSAALHSISEYSTTLGQCLEDAKGLEGLKQWYLEGAIGLPAPGPGLKGSFKVEASFYS